MQRPFTSFVGKKVKRERDATVEPHPTAVMLRMCIFGVLTLPMGEEENSSVCMVETWIIVLIRVWSYMTNGGPPLDI